MKIKLFKTQYLVINHNKHNRRHSAVFSNRPCDFRLQYSHDGLRLIPRNSDSMSVSDVGNTNER